MFNPRAEENNGFGPLYKSRGYGSLFASAIIIFLYLSFTFFLEWKNPNLDSWTVYSFAIGFSFLAVLIGELIRRVCLLTEECRHLDARYGGSFKKAFRVIFGFKNNTLVCVLAGIAVVIATVFCNTNWASVNHDYVRVFALNAVFMPIFVYVVGLRDPSMVEYSQNNEQQNKNLADGLAWSFYFGYLKFVLPALKGQINETEEFRYKIDVQKLFIVIPKNCQVFDKISNKDTDPQTLIKSLDNLEPLKKNRGGIQDRIYRHTVHSITEKKPGGNDKEHFCVMEYATPLMTLADMSDDPNAGLSREERDQQVVLFTSKLKKILDDDKKCKGNYELITFSGDKDLAQIMIDALKTPALEMGH